MKRTFIKAKYDLLPTDMLIGESKCPSYMIDGYHTPETKHYIYPKSKIIPFYQWMGNNGYCGEVSMIQAGLAVGGIFTGQFNARLLCGAQLNTGNMHHFDISLICIYRYVQPS